MAHKHNLHHHSPTHAVADGPAAATTSVGNDTGFAPAPSAVATRAYFSYVAEGSLPGHDVRHWLEAEAQLVMEHSGI